MKQADDKKRSGEIWAVEAQEQEEPPDQRSAIGYAWVAGTPALVHIRTAAADVIVCWLRAPPHWQARERQSQRYRTRVAGTPALRCMRQAITEGIVSGLRALPHSGA